MNTQPQQPMYYMMPPPGAQNLHGAEQAAPVVMQPQQPPAQPESGMTDTALQFGEMGANMVAQSSKLLGPIGLVAAPAAVGLNALNSGREATRGMDAIKEQYREPVAAALGIDPSAVNEAAIRKAAENIPALKQSVDAFDGLRTVSPIKATANLGTGIGSFALGTMLAAPLGFAAPIGGMAASYLASTLTDKAADALAANAGVVSPEHTACAKISDINAKLQNGEHISPRDVFIVFAKCDPELNRLVVDRAGVEPDQVNAVQLQHIMEKYHPNLAKSCQYLAEKINSGEKKPEILAFIDPKELTQQEWVSAQRAEDMNTYPQGQNVAPLNQAANNNLPPQTMIMTDGAAYQGRGVAQGAAAGRPVMGAFTQQLANTQQGIQTPQR